MHSPLLCGLDPIGSKPHSRGLCGGRGSCPLRTGERGWPNRASLLLRRHLRALHRRHLQSPSRPPSLPHRLQAARRPHLHRPPSQQRRRRPHSRQLLIHSTQQSRRRPRSRPLILPGSLSSRRSWSGRLLRQPRRLSSLQPPILSGLVTWSGSRFPVHSPFSPRPLCSMTELLCSLHGRLCFAFLPRLSQ